MKPVIGVMPLWDEEKESIWMLPGYLNGIRRAGGIPVIFPLSQDEEELKRLAGMCDGFLFTGGQDVSPDLYQEELLGENVITCRERDQMEAIVLREALGTGKPVLGICRGIQFINVYFGGTLYQDLPLQHPSEVDHNQHIASHIPIHEVRVLKDSPLYELLRTNFLPVNSYHHQAVKDLAPGLKAMAVSSDRIIEAVYMPDHPFLWAVQWHPEFSWKTDAVSRLIFDAFIRKMQ